MTTGNGQRPELPGFEGVGGESRGGVLGMKDELEHLKKERAQLSKEIDKLEKKALPILPKHQRRAELVKQIKTLDGRITTLEGRVIEALNAQ